jgi:hypothetical protein
MRRLVALASVVGVVVASAGQLAGSSDVQTMTGWFADAECAAPRVAKGIIAPNNPDCVKRCLEKGVAPVFISEQAKAMLAVKDYPSVADDLGYHLEVTGTVDKAAKSISVKSVKRLSSGGAFCALPQGRRVKK